MCWSTMANAEDHTPWGLVDSVVEGTLGTLRNTRDGHLLLARPDGTTTKIEAPMSGDPPRLDSYVGTQRHFLERMLDGQPFITDIVDNRVAMQIVFAGYDSARTRSVIPLHA
ncbi:MAG: hypothetical protein U1D30_25210 [Planctomycetota bacterium]